MYFCLGVVGCYVFIIYKRHKKRSRWDAKRRDAHGISCGLCAVDVNDRIWCVNVREKVNGGMGVERDGEI